MFNIKCLVFLDFNCYLLFVDSVCHVLYICSFLFNFTEDHMLDKFILYFICNPLKIKTLLLLLLV